MEIEDFRSENGELLIEELSIEVKRLVLQLLYFLKGMFTCFREHSFTFIPCPGQIVDNIVLIHQIEVISISIKRQAAARLELENTNMVFLMCIFWISFHDLALAILLNDIVNEAQ